MDINRIALYLAGKFSPYYQAPFDKLELLEIIRDHFYRGFPDDLFKLVDSENFYSMALNKVQRQDSKDKTEKLKQIIKALNIPEDAGGLKKSDLISDKLKELKKEYEDMKKMTSATRKGNKFEEIVCKIFDVFGLKTRDPDKSGTDKFDGAIELDGNNYLIESKWKVDTDKDDVGEFGSKFRDTHLIGTLGLFVFDETVLKKDKLDHIKSRAKDTKCILLITTKDLEKVFNEEIGMDDLVRKLKRRMAEEGKPYLETE